MICQLFNIFFIILIITNGIDCVVNGLRACSDQFPYVAAIWVDRRLVCTGGILDKRHILTAAHCLELGQKESYGVVVGTTEMRNVLTRRMRVEEFYTHPNFTRMVDLERNGQHLSNDIGIIKLQADLEWNQYIKPIPLKKEPGIAACDSVIAGYGGIDPESPRTSLTLEWTKLTVLHTALCRRFFRSMTTTEICAADPRGRSSASPGDSGAPVVSGGLLVGVIKGGPRGQRGPAVILRTYFYIKFIEEILNYELPQSPPIQNVFEFLNEEGVLCT